MKKLWGGRFKERTSKLVESFTESISFDKRLWKYDIQGSISHTKMLAKQQIISCEESQKIIKGLEEIADEIETGKFLFKEELEDIHMNIEYALTKKIGVIGEKLHTARSRNDQIALDLRLFIRTEIKEIINLIKKFQNTLLNVSIKYLNALMPGYTHLQRAQPVLLSHHLLAYVEMLQRDVERLRDSLKRVNQLPLGSCALAGTSLPIDRAYVAKLLGFESISHNSIDAVSDRDFVIEFLSNSSILMMHLSRLAEEIILWSTEEFNFLQLPDTFATGSSIMPQKKNPDVAELVRGKTGRIYGNLVSMLTLMKALPLSYNRDMQEDKIFLFDAVDTTKACLTVFDEMFQDIRFNTKKMYETAGDSYSTATDVVEYLVKKGLPFRRAHEITGKIIIYCEEKKKKLEELKLEELNKFSKLFSDDIYSCLNAEGSIKNKISLGSTSSKEVSRQIKRFRKIIAEK